MEEEPEKFYHSSLITTSHTVSWTLNGVSEIEKIGAWTALACEVELPLGTHRISRWSISLFESDGTMFIRPKILSPQNENVTYRLAVRIGGSVWQFAIGETHSKVKEPPQFQLGEKRRILSATNGEDQLEVALTLKLFSQDFWETK